MRAESRRNVIKLITRAERDYLVSQGCRPNIDLFKSHSKHPKYYAVERQRVLQKLLDFQKSTTKKVNTV